MPHYLEPLVRPDSIAVVGASRRPGAVGNTVLKNLLRGEFPGPLCAVNPRYDEVEGVPCHPSLSALSQPVQHVIFTVGDQRLEAVLDEAIACGVEAAMIYSSLVPEADSAPPLRERVQEKAKQAGLLLCGANSMGFYNFAHNVWAGGFPTRSHRKPGNVALISQSGAGMSGIVDPDERIDFSLAVSTGLELTVTTEDYLDYALEQPETRVIGLFLETSRRPEKLVAAFRKAADRNVPLVAVKVGRTELAAQLGVSHSGALAGSDAVYDAVFDRYGVQRVDDMEQLATALIMFAQPHPVADGGIVTIHDSGGERQLLIDAAAKLDAPLTEISARTQGRLEALLDPGLPAVNPLDVWSAGGPDYEDRLEDCFAALLQDQDAALGAVVHDRAAHGRLYPEYVRHLRRGHEASGKPVFLVSNRQGSGADPLVVETTRAGFPVLDGIASFLTGAKCLLAYRDFEARPVIRPPCLSDSAMSGWRARLADTDETDEIETGRFLRDCGIPMVTARLASDEAGLAELMAEMSYPVVMKTAMPGIHHKSDVGGVRLNICDEAELVRVYREMSRRLGNRALIAPMLDAPGVEMILGMTTDEQFGPMIIMGIGGVHAELLQDVVTVAPPFDAATALRSLGRLKMRKLLDGARGAPPVDVPAFCEAATILSVIAVEFADLVREVDINPIKVYEQGCMGLDALMICKTEGVNKDKMTA
ncbi:MAG: acetate--CoA ligase family protein [Gammaproteobacteria bacterium]|nr:acetate--CoA ligase family protein [Gammaproteobacteria bacterium]